MTTETQIITGVDFVPIPTQDFDTAVAFYGTTLGMRRSAYVPERHFAEFETGTVTLTVIVPEEQGYAFTPIVNAPALHVNDIEVARATLTDRGVQFDGDTLDTGVCHMAFFADPDGNALMLHHRYAPRTPES
jgi:predicted enzyme related to lactoylglutathione lyase